jgi:hypothetical protein
MLTVGPKWLSIKHENSHLTSISRADQCHKYACIQSIVTPKRRLLWSSCCDCVDMQSQLSSTLVVIAAFSALSVGCCASSLLSGPSTSLPEPGTDSARWGSQQGNCQHWFADRKTLTAADRATVSSLTSINEHSSCSKSAQAIGSCTAGTLSAKSDSWCPALLWTFTGTGNTMTRMLIEAASGWYTGSVYTGMHSGLEHHVDM